MPDDRRLRCPCGELLVAPTDDGLVQSAMDHLELAHPNLRDKYTEQDILALAAFENS